MTRWIPTVLALALFALHGLSALLGLEDHLSVLSGTPTPGVSLEVAALGAGFHLLSWLGAVLVAPILLIASSLFELSEVLGRGHSGRASRQGSGAHAEGSTPSSGAVSLRSSAASKSTAKRASRRSITSSIATSRPSSRASEVTPFP